MNEPRKVLYIDTALRIWGGQRSLYELIDNLDRGRYVPVIAVPKASRTENLFGVLAETHTFPAHSAIDGRPTKPLPAFRSVYLISRLAKNIKPDIIHANTFLAALFVSFIPFLNVPWILHQRDSKDHGLLGRLVAGRAAKIIAITDSTAALFNAAELRKPLSVITEGVDLSFTAKIAEKDFKPLLKEELNVEESETLVGTVATISPQKSQHELLEAADRLRGIRGLYFVCVGEPYRPEDREYLNELIRKRAELNLEDRFFFADYTNDLANLYGSIDILVHPAKSEGLGRVILEAMGAGVPVLARDDGGPAEIITPGVNGFLYQPGDLSDLVGKLRNLINDPELRNGVSEGGMITVTKEYTPRKTAERIQEVYDELLGIPII
ncbi:MAG: glycosyltransferase family 4 protein [Candidatus Coatesbacteria bacterium]|nr:MAG: glycosyltransferase family 4 protein [Candidatus Coatesbacteria bacterium]